MKEKIGHYLIEAFYDLSYTKVRSFLAMLSVLMGTLAVSGMVQFGQLAEYQAAENFKALGTNRVLINLYEMTTRGQQSIHLTSNQYSRITPHNLSSDIEFWSPILSSFQPIYVNGKSYHSFGISVLPEFFGLQKLKLQDGRFFLEEERKAFCILGSKIYDTLQSQHVNVRVGSKIGFSDSFCEVIGVLQPTEHTGVFNYDVNESIIFPLPYMLEKNRGTYPAQFLFSFNEQKNLTEVEKTIRDQFSWLLPKVNTEFISSQEILEQIHKQNQIFTILLSLIGSLSLIVGGVGILNIMLLSIHHRRNEIGIRIALGATRMDILLQFLAEAVVLTTLGGIAGILLSILLAASICFFVDWAYVLSPWPIFIGLSLSLMMGLFFGFFPAWRASRLNPIELLKGV